jgi:DHA1 family bicyclomycin/chloramphenicol resistance-like MFS transporter
VLLAGLALFGLATLACAFAPSIGALTLARAFQALGASGPIVLGRAMVRDLYDGPRAGRELARMGMIMGLVPAVAPVIGGVLQVAFGWRSTFLASLAFGLVLAVVIITVMPETLRARSPQPLSLVSIFKGFGTLLHNRAFRVYVALTALAYAGLFAFISGSSFVLIGVYGLTPVEYGFSFGFGVLGYITGTIIAQRLVGRRGMDGVIAIGVACLAGGGLAMLVGVLTGFGGPAGVVVPMALYACGVGLTMPQAQASAMMPFPDRAGAASSFNGLCQMLLSACVGLLVGHLLKNAALPLPLVMSALGVAALVLFRATRGIRAAKS